MAKKPRGRPVLDEKREESVLLKLLPKEKAAYKAAAEGMGVPLTVWIRMTLNKAATEGSE